MSESDESYEKLFEGPSGMADRLRLKEGETLEEAVERLRARGWQIPSIGQLAEGSDSAGKYFYIK